MVTSGLVEDFYLLAITHAEHTRVIGLHCCNSSRVEAKGDMTITAIA